MEPESTFPKIVKIKFQIRREMDDKLRLERNSLKEALDAAHAGDKERAIESTRYDVT